MLQLNLNYIIKMFKYFTSTLLFFFITVKIIAVPAYPYPITYRLPDGSNITITLKGDEYGSWAESEDGYTLLRNAKGFFEYAVKDIKGDIVLSGVQANNVSQRDSKEKALLRQLPKKLEYSTFQKNVIKQLKVQRAKVLSSHTRTSSFIGSVTAPIFLVEFADNKFQRTANEFEMLCNNLNYTSTADGTITGSVRDYFKTVSYGQLDFHVDVYGPLTLTDSIKYYNQDYTYNDGNSTGDPSRMVKEAALLADQAGCDFSKYDLDNDGYVDEIHVIFAGYGQEAGEPLEQSIWSHAWAVYDNVVVDGKWLGRYSCSPELQYHSGVPSQYLGKITHVGVICHELGHVFGLPDLYDNDYDNSGGQALHLGDWCLMASGSWNGPSGKPGSSPAMMSAWCREKLGWSYVKELSTPRKVTLSNNSLLTTPNYQTDTLICKYQTTTSNEYFLLENRQQVGWDTYIPNSGMLIYHIDGNYINNHSDAINADPSHRGIYVKQADGGALSNADERSGDTYPSATNNTFDDTSVPNSKSWSGKNTNKSITDITLDSGTKKVSFNFMYNALSSDATLARLSVDGYSLSPSFSPSVLSYRVTVPTEVSTISISATSTHSGATIVGIGTKNVAYGQNVYSVTVTAQNGTVQKVYTVTVEKKQPTKIDDIEDNSSVLIFPNPAKDSFCIKSDMNVEKVYLIDMLGNEVFSSANKGDFDIADLPNGQYLVRVVVEGRSMAVGKLIKR